MISSDLNEEMEDSLSCSVCFERYDVGDHMPKVLQCQHTFCEQCLTSTEKYGAVQCPMCRESTAWVHIHTNLAVRHIVEAMLSKKSRAPSVTTVSIRKWVCPDHPASKECTLFCMDCCHPLCASCLKTLTKGIHKDHIIEEIDCVHSRLKESLRNLLTQKIDHLGVLSTFETEKLRQLSMKRARHVNALVNMTSMALVAWKEARMREEQKKTLQASSAMTDRCTQLTSSWNQKLKITEFEDMLTAYKELQTENASLEINVEESLNEFQQDSINTLEEKLGIVCANIRKLMKENAMPLSPALMPTNLPNINNCNSVFELNGGKLDGELSNQQQQFWQAITEANSEHSDGKKKNQQKGSTNESQHGSKGYGAEPERSTSPKGHSKGDGQAYNRGDEERYNASYGQYNRQNGNKQPKRQMVKEIPPRFQKQKQLQLKQQQLKQQQQEDIQQRYQNVQHFGNSKYPKPQLQHPNPDDLQTRYRNDGTVIVQEVNAHIFSASEPNIANCVGADLIMSSKFANDFQKRYGGMMELFHSHAKPGDVVPVEYRDNFVYYLITKERVYDFASLQMLETCLLKLRDECICHGVQNIAMPTIGCGSDRLNWSAVRDLLVKVFESAPITIVVYIKQEE